jgi:hypothetical protein
MSHDSGAVTHDPSVAVRRRHLPGKAGEEMNHRFHGHFYLYDAQRMSWPLPIGLKRMPLTLAA